MNACAVDGCERSVYARDWCNAHYKRWLTQGDGFDRTPAHPRVKDGMCVVEGCESRRDARGLCPTHYMRWRRTGDATKVTFPRGTEPADIIQRLWLRSIVDPETGCWTWTGSCNLAGYGQTGINYRLVMVHRIAKQIFDGFDETLTLDHLCRNHACWNPAHLDPCTLAENILRGTSPAALHAVKTHCMHGHEFTPENTGIYSKPNGRVMRMCKACRNARARDRYRQERAA